MHAPYSRTVYDLLLEQAAKAPDRPLLLTAEGSVAYGEMAARAAAVAGGLAAEGLCRGDRIGLLSDNRSEWLETFFGAAALGVCVAPFSTWSTLPELEFLLADAGVSHLFTLQRYGDRDLAAGVEAMAGGLPSLRRVVPLDGEAFQQFRAATPIAEAPPGARASAADPLVLLYTSGSSSRPKSVPLLHYAAIENGFNIGERQGLGPIDRVLVSIPLFWSYGAVNALMATLSHGATLVLQPRFEPEGALDLIERHRATSIYTLPAMTNALLAAETFSPARTASLRTGVTIGAPQDVMRAATELGAAEICNIYGQTESYGNCCVTPHDWPLERRAVCQGPPLPGVTIRIRDPETGAAMAAGEIGEIEVRGYLTPGYAGDSARHNGEVFTADGFFRTGDLGALRPDGAIAYAGRRSEMIKRSGINVSPAEVEEALQQSAAVGLAGVAGVADADKGEIIVAFVVPRPGAQEDADALRGHCRSLLSSYKLPDRIFFRRELPLTPTGKLMRRELAALAADAVNGDAG